MPDAAATREVATIGSRLSFNSAFQPAWKAAAASTARKTKRSMACGRRWLLGNASARRARWSAASYPHQRPPRNGFATREPNSLAVTARGSRLRRNREELRAMMQSGHAYRHGHTWTKRLDAHGVSRQGPPLSLDAAVRLDAITSFAPDLVTYRGRGTVLKQPTGALPCQSIG